MGQVSAGLNAALAQLFVALPELEAAAVVSFDGLSMASALPEGMDEERVAAMSAALLALGEKAANGLGRGELSQVYIEAARGTVFLMSAREQAVVVAVAPRGAKPGLMMYELKRAADQIGALLEASMPRLPAGLREAPVLDQPLGSHAGPPAAMPRGWARYGTTGTADSAMRA